MEVILIRHGQTAGNLAGRYIGRTNEPLCQEGIQSVREMGEFPRISFVYLSPMRRACETAALLFPCAEQAVYDDLREMDFGDFEGRSAKDMEDDAAYRTWVDGGCLGKCPNGESTAEFSARICTAFDRIIRNAVLTSNPSGRSSENNASGAGKTRVIIVAHGGTIMAVMQKYARPSRDYFDWHVKNACGWRASFDEKNWGKYSVLTDYEKMEVLRL